jgi:hypothetical protein
LISGWMALTKLKASSKVMVLVLSTVSDLVLC